MHKLRALALALLIVGVSFINSSLAVVAQDSTGSGLIISPTRTELEIAPGGSGKVDVTLSNVSGGDINALAVINDFNSDDLTGNPQIIPNSDEQLPTSIRDFVTNLEDIPLAEGEKRDFELSIEIPEDAAPGAYYGIVRYTAIPQDREITETERQIALSASVGTLVLITVPGEIREQIQVENFQVQNNGTAGTFFTTAPTEASMQIRNNGNGFSKPFGRIVLTRGGTEVHSYELNNSEPKANILPSSTRTFVNSLEGVTTPGRYTLTANVSHSSGGEVITRTVSFWYLPVWLLVTLAAVILLLIIGAYVLYRVKFRTNKRR